MPKKNYIHEVSFIGVVFVKEKNNLYISYEHPTECMTVFKIKKAR